MNIQDDFYIGSLEDYLEPRFTLFYIHVPKTGGSTMTREILIREYAQDKIFGHFFMGLNYMGNKGINHWKNLSPEERQQFHLVTGHYPFGLHEVLDKPAAYITMLRNPVDRVISLYNHMRRKERHKHHEKIQRMTLQDFLEDETFLEADNYQVRQLAGIGWYDGYVGYGACAQEHLTRAQENIKHHFLLAGITEKFDQSILLFRYLLGWSTPFYKRINVHSGNNSYNNSEGKHIEIDSTIIKLVEERNQLDIELYRYVDRLLDEKVSKLGKTFEVELSEFQLINGKRTLFLSLEKDLKRAKTDMNHVIDDFHRKDKIIRSKNQKLAEYANLIKQKNSQIRSQSEIFIKKNELSQKKIRDLLMQLSKSEQLLKFRNSRLQIQRKKIRAIKVRLRARNKKLFRLKELRSRVEKLELHIHSIESSKLWRLKTWVDRIRAKLFPTRL
ncbi:sulfotransferase family 2 domain-containing protein [Vacuolonema iberomarrocanum]|uniref:sulfotransferase family 2 domain-containing protein n=1 Tax=Vacuolonema iberomarrocanum TaxID=3454632 RepID=UPI001A02C048|nr:sulfotransferase family 2 domain-containing protein [filamentous cyanobacterium LEGE 07170]